MKKFLLLAVMVFVLCLPVLGQEDGSLDDPEPIAAPSEMSNTEFLEGKIVKDGANAFLQTETEKIALLPCDSLTELLKTEGLENKTFALEGERVPAKDGKSEGFMTKGYSENVPEPVGDIQVVPEPEGTDEGGE